MRVSLCQCPKPKLHQIWKANLEWIKAQRSAKFPGLWGNYDSPSERTGWSSWSNNTKLSWSAFPLQYHSTVQLLNRVLCKKVGLVWFGFPLLGEAASFQNRNDSFMYIQKALKSLHNVWSEKQEDSEWISSCLNEEHCGASWQQSHPPGAQPTFAKTTRSLPCVSYLLSFWRRVFLPFTTDTVLVLKSYDHRSYTLILEP